VLDEWMIDDVSSSDGAGHGGRTLAH